MNLRKDRPTDKEILTLIEQGKTTLQIIAELNTHSQRITKLRREHGYIPQWTYLGSKGNKVKYVKGEKQKVTKRSKIEDSFILNFF